nr:helix-turn-helix transcriptional regulator [Actinomycetales bacterium]
MRLREHSGRASTFHYGTAEKILAHGEPTRGEISAEGSRRRLRALAVMGWTLGEISERSGLHRRTLSAVRSEEAEHVKAETARVIAALFEEIGMDFGGADVIAREARARGWIGPLGWDDVDDLEEMGEPVGSEEPDHIAVARVVEGGGAAQGAVPLLRASEQEAAITALAMRGHSNGEIARRLGVSTRTVLRHRHRLGFPARAA